MRVRRAGVTWRTMRISYPRVNVGVGDKEERMLITGLHTVADIFCNVCLSVLGWKYVSVEPSCSEASCQPSFTHVLKASSFLLPATANLPRTA
mmetsp:Transcript_10105/g.30877  ORF Transcript_10105/g.30877 Transcript_10105/m.30877 type:complete len:93 (+) Transcript_10105:195-473(+)